MARGAGGAALAGGGWPQPVSACAAAAALRQNWGRMRYLVGMLGMLAVARLLSGCDVEAPPPPAAGPHLAAAGDLNNLYVVETRGAGNLAGFRFWQRDARGTWHDGGSVQGTPTAIAAWRENLMVFFASGRYGMFGLAPPVIEPAPVPAWAAAAACDDGLAADAFGWNAAGEPVTARYEGDKWSWRRVDADLKRDKVLDPALVRFGGRLFIVWREEEPSLIGASPNFRLWFVYQDKDGWHVPNKSRLYVASVPLVAATSSTMTCLFLKTQGDGKPDQWTLALYSTADEDWHETGPLAGGVPPEPLALARSGQAFYVAGMADGRPVVAAVDVSTGRAGQFLPLVPQEKATKETRPDHGGLAILALASLVLILLLVTYQRSRRAAGKPSAPGAGRAWPGAGGSAKAPPGSGCVPASIFRRGAALAIDYVILSILMTPFIVQFEPDLAARLTTIEQVLAMQLSWQEMVMLQGLHLALILVYFTVAEGIFGRTIGKRLMGLSVRTDFGMPISFRQALVRNLLRIVDEFPGFYLLGLVSILIGPRPQRLGDRVARTLVVVASPPAP